MPGTSGYGAAMYAPSGAATVPSRDDRRTGETFVLVGAIIALALFALAMLVALVVGVVFLVSWDRATADFEWSSAAGAFVGFYVVLFGLIAVLHVVGLFLAFRGRSLSRAGEPGRGWSRPLAGGILIVLTNQLAGVLVIVGAVFMRPTDAASASRPTAV